MKVSLQANLLGYLEMDSPYDPAFLDQFKRAVPAPQRQWDKQAKRWLLDPTVGPTVAQLIESHFWQAIELPQTDSTVAQPSTRKLRLEYLGQCKERATGEKSAFGYADGSWSVIFPETVLRAFFAAGNGPETLYSLLGVSESAGPDEIKSGHRRAARSWHPDTCTEPDAADRFRAIQSAWETLRDPQTKKKYDAGLYFERSLTGQSLKHSRWDNYVSPYRCGVLTVTGVYRLNLFHVQEIHAWKEITNADGAVLVTSWPRGAEHFVTQWVPF